MRRRSDAPGPSGRHRDIDFLDAVQCQQTVPFTGNFDLPRSRHIQTANVEHQSDNGLAQILRR